jgi:hypothetical protein
MAPAGNLITNFLLPVPALAPQHWFHLIFRALSTSCYLFLTPRPLLHITTPPPPSRQLVLVSFINYVTPMVSTGVVDSMVN